MHPELTCGKLIKFINSSIERNVNNTLREKDITASQMALMMTIRHMNCKEDRECTLKDLERKLNISQPTTVGLAHRLERKGLIVVKTSERDRRVKIAALTESGMKLLEETKSFADEAEENLLSCLTEEEKSELLTLLKKVFDNVRKEGCCSCSK